VNEYFLNIGEVWVANKPSVIKCYGLGSCIGLFLYDRVNKIGGGAHIFLPSNQGNSKSTVFANHALDKLMALISGFGGNVNALRAVIVGGADVFGKTRFGNGDRNSKDVKQMLLEKKIYIHADVTGGTISRSVRFYTSDGSHIITSAYETSLAKLPLKPIT